MKSFAALYNVLDQTTRTNEKVAAMAEYFSRTASRDVTWAVALLTGRRPSLSGRQVRRPVSSSNMREWTTELAGIPYWLFEESYAVVGDLSETISLLIPAGESGGNESLSHIMEDALTLPDRTDTEKKEWLYGAWRKLSRTELLVFNKLITGSFRVGVSAQLVYKALAKAFSIDERTVAHRLMGNWTPQAHDIDALLSTTDHATDHSKPYPFYLAYQLDVPPAELGDVKDWQIERKYDGIRGQLIVRGGEVNTWSRGEELMTDRLVEFNGLHKLLPEGTVIDGEFIAFRERILPFSEMQKRTGRRNISKKILLEVPVAMICYDLLEHGGHDIRQKPLRERRALLESLVSDQHYPMLQLAPLLVCNDWDELDTLRNDSKKLGCEGLMLKHRDSIYETGRRRGKWWKWKVDPYSVDAVLIYAQPGHGRRANLYTDYTFAVWDNGELVTFAKAYSGLTDKEILEVDAWIKRNTIEKFGPVRSVKAELVFEIAFEGINRSTRHKSGIALRFPRIARWRKDKRKEEANTRQDLMQLLDAL
jgi:DNA ligase 1